MEEQERIWRQGLTRNYRSIVHRVGSATRTAQELRALWIRLDGEGDHPVFDSLVSKYGDPFQEVV